MTHHVRVHAVVFVVAAVLIASSVGLTVAAQGTGQGGGRAGRKDPRLQTGPSTPSLVGWTDLETWNRDSDGDGNLEIGLGLQLNASGSSVMVAFDAHRPRTSPTNVLPREILMTMVPIYNPTWSNWNSLTLVVTTKEKEPRQISMALSSKIITYPPGPLGPGDAPVKAQVTLSAAEFVQIADAGKLQGSVLGRTVTFRDDQLRSMRALAQRLGLILK